MCACCGEKGKNQNLKERPFDDLYLNLDNYKFQFDKNRGEFRLSNNKEQALSPDELNRLNNQRNELANELKEKEIRIEELNKKIKEIEDKIGSMNQILEIDVSEKEYINELGAKIQPSG